ncbi:MAG TPA: hypothetical protein VL240_10205 [Candidatus Binatia bacterium]|nr:hypothetical protein [Candidatus Binatia bacterium]
MADEKKPATPGAQTPSAPKATTAGSIPFDQFTESTMSAVMRAAAAQKLSHVPIVIGIIFHPGLGGSGGGGYGGGTPTCGFASTVKPFFTDCYRSHMLFMFDLWDPTAVQNNWQAIHDAVANGSMPAPGCPGTFDQSGFLTAFQCWKDQGFPA